MSFGGAAIRFCYLQIEPGELVPRFQSFDVFHLHLEARSSELPVGRF